MALRSSPNRAYRLPSSCLLNLSFGKRQVDSDQEERNTTPQRNVRTGLDYASAARIQESHYTNFAEDYLSNPRHERGHFDGRGHSREGVSFKEHGHQRDGISLKGRGRGRAHLPPSLARWVHHYSYKYSDCSVLINLWGP